ncbi:transcriptional regulator [Edwardsiella piscicida]|uniref:transcriptional regulator n=1 Tax=Edwardsiella piscicida TaxID=1263550 RepID=UPI001E2A739D|nr:transcriptional regulator [Edwardsiella piscicida]WLJ47361.1 transcriptional regulator [Edwardsiella piscicida]
MHHKQIPEMNDLLRWKKESTKEQWSELAELANTTVGNLNQLAYGWRRASTSKAESIANATLKFITPSPVKKEDIAFAPVYKPREGRASAG